MKLPYLLTSLTLITATSYIGATSSLVAAPLPLGPDIVPNYSFEQTTNPGVHGVNASSDPINYVTDWTINVPNDSAVGTYNDTTNPNLTGGKGTNGLFVQGYYGYFEQDVISSAITTIKKNTTYQLTVSMGVPSNYPDPSLSDAPGVILNVVDSSGKVDASTSYYVDNSQNPAFIYYQGSITGSSLPSGTMHDFTLTFTTGNTPFDLGESVHLLLSSYNGDNGNSVNPVVFDNVRMLESVPEPSTYAMMLAGLAFLGFCVRRKSALVK
jgi:hypothetical protein